MKDKILIDFGSRVKLLRQDIGISQEGLGDKAGLHRTYVGMVERAEKNISLLNIKKIADALEISVGELMEGL
ncbi:helix-turn-helix domain-containing protein [Halomonas caseinilytica]|uniref:helix-turn-helix domain-containing protein n=1 Tax=Halomonas caseinilytica TaxID=438744 RepID=UPI0009F1D4C6|nr:helix-turn-helix transcriptional regulator [Halomonas caseinilytica]